MTRAVRYEIEHLSRYCYTALAQQCVMLLCLEPREDRGQRLLDFEIETQPPANLNRETDCFGNTRHLLDLHQAHQTLEITTRATVEVASAPPLPARLHPGAWEEIRSLGESCVYWDFTHPSALVRPSPALTAFVDRHHIAPMDDPARKSAATVAHAPHLLAIHSGKHLGGIPRRAHPRNRSGRLPRLCPPDDRHRALLGYPRPLCLGLPEPNRSRRAGAKQCHARLGRMPAARAGLDRLRSDQPELRWQGGESTYRSRARLPRRVADARRPPRRRRNPPRSQCADAFLSY